MLGKMGVFAGLMVLAMIAQAEGKRALVVLKGTSGVSNTMAGASVDTKAVAAALTAQHFQVESQLSAVQMIVVKINGPEDLQDLQRNPNVAFVDEEVFLPAPRPVNGFVQMSTKQANARAMPQQTPWGIKAVKAKESWAVSRKGAGVRVMVLDSGIDRDHPAVKANLEKAKDFVGDGNGPYDYADSIGHGTHVVGTIAAIEDAAGFTGVAPQAKILMGRVCSINGCSTISIAQGLNWAVQEKADIISMSLGGGMSPPSVRAALTKAESQGVTVVAASGNDGSGIVGYPAALSSVIAVGAIGEDMKRAPFSQYGPELDVVAPGVSVISTVPLGSGRESVVSTNVNNAFVAINSAVVQGGEEFMGQMEGEIVYAGLGSPEEIAKVNLKGKVALMSRGTILFVDKVINAMRAGAKAIVIHNNEPGLIRGAIQPPEPVRVPVFMIEQQAGLDVKQALDRQQKISLKVQVEATDYASFDGTSMATPHVTGVVALMKATNRGLTPAQIRALLKKTAQPLAPSLTNETGAGLVDAAAAVSAAVAAPVVQPLAGVL